jgi:hypothetical protein
MLKRRQLLAIASSLKRDLGASCGESLLGATLVISEVHTPEVRVTLDILPKVGGTM